MKIKTICRSEIIYKNGKSPLAIRFTHQRAHKLVSLGISVEPHYWDKEAEMLTADCPDRAALQSKIDGTLTGFQKKIKRLEALDIPVNFDTLFEVKTAHIAGITIEQGFNEEIERLESLGKQCSNLIEIDENSSKNSDYMEGYRYAYEFDQEGYISKIIETWYANGNEDETTVYEINYY